MKTKKMISDAMRTARRAKAMMKTARKETLNDICALVRVARDNKRIVTNNESNVSNDEANVDSDAEETHLLQEAMV